MATRWKPPHFSETFIVAGFFYKQKIGICKKKKNDVFLHVDMKKKFRILCTFICTVVFIS